MLEEIKTYKDWQKGKTLHAWLPFYWLVASFRKFWLRRRSAYTRGQACWCKLRCASLWSDPLKHSKTQQTDLWVWRNSNSNWLTLNIPISFLDYVTALIKNFSFLLYSAFNFKISIEDIRGILTLLCCDILQISSLYFNIFLLDLYFIVCRLSYMAFCALDTV
jgi:hypothetical protein